MIYTCCRTIDRDYVRKIKHDRPDDAAEVYAELVFLDMDCPEKIGVTVTGPDGAEHKFVVRVEIRPDFYVEDAP